MLGMAGEKAPALRQRHRMRKDAIDLVDYGAGDRDQVVADAQQRLALDFDVVGEQQVEVLGDGAGEAVLNGNDGGIDFAVGESGKDLGREGAGNDGGAGNQLQRGFVAE